MSNPFLTEYFDASSAAYTQYSTSSPEAGWKILRISDVSQLTDGFYAVAYEDTTGDVIIAYGPTDPSGATAYSNGTISADLKILGNQWSAALTDAVSFAQSVTSQFSNLSTYVTGHSLGGAEAEAAIASDAQILGGVTFAAPGLTQYAGFSLSLNANNLINYIDRGDPIGNYANDGSNNLLSAIVSPHFHVGTTVFIGNDSGDIDLLLEGAAFEILREAANRTLSVASFKNWLAQPSTLIDHSLFLTYGPDLFLSPSPSHANVGDTVGASVSSSGSILVNSAALSGTIDSVDKSYGLGAGTPSAGTIISSGTLAGTPVDKDWYSFSTIVGATYTVTATSQNITSGRVALSIKNGAGNTVDVNQIGNTADDVIDSASGTSTITFTATGAQYYAAVSAGGADGVWQFATGAYNIGVSKLASQTAVSINDQSISEGNSGTQVETFIVTRTGGTAAFDVNYTTSDGSATVADGDYTATMGTLHFGANINTQPIQVTIKGDTKVEPDQTFSVLLSGATNGASIIDNQGIGTITNDDANHSPTVTITTTGGLTASAAQSISGTVDVADAGATVTVFDGANNIGTAIVAANGTWTANVTLSVQGPNTLVAKATNSSGTGVSNSAFYTLDTASYNLTPSSPTATENQGSLVFTLTRTNETDAQTVFVQTDDTHGTQNPNNKYFNEQNLVAVPFAQYASSATFSVTINDIHATSGTQTFGLSVYPSLNASGTPLAAAIFTINDTDTNTGPLTGNIITNDIVTGTTTISSPVNIFNSATLQNNGVIDINSGGSIGGDNAGGILFNTSGNVININTADASSKTIDVTRVNNDGTIIVSPGSGNVATIWTANGGISDSGAIQVLSGTLQLHMFGAASAASLNASGISVAASANLLFTGADTFTVSGGTYNVAGTTIVGSSSFGANVVFGAGTAVNIGSDWSIQSGSVDFSAATLSGTFSSLSLSPDAFNLKLGANNVAINNFSSFLINVTDSGTITLTGTAVTDATWLGGGTIINEGKISAPAGWQDGELTTGETFINHGVVNNLRFDSGSLVTNKSDGALNLQSGEAAGGTITNEGSIHFSGLGSGNGQVNSILNNTGTVEFSTASGWSLNGGGTSNASGFVLDAGITLFFSGNAAADTYTIAGGTFDGGGNLWVVSGAKVKFASSTQVDTPFHNDGTIEVAGGTLTLETALTGSGSVAMGAGTTLALVAPQGFTNSISGFSSGDTIDLVGVTATGASINANDQLVVTDAGTIVATLQMIGNYPGAGLQFLLASDGTGGTKITLGIPGAPAVSAGAIATFIDSNSPAAVVLDGDLAVISGGNPTLASATVSVSSGFETGDILTATTAGTAITASYNALTGLLSLSGNDTPANYESVLRSATFNSITNAQQSGADPSRTLTWIVNDGTRVSSAATSSVTIEDAAPTVSAQATPTFIGGTPTPVTLDDMLVVSDIDSTTLLGATVSIASGFNSGDLLGVTTTGTAITIASNTGGVLKLTGTDTLAHYEAVLQTVNFTSSDATEGSRIIVWTVNDGSHASALATSSIDISAAGSVSINDASITEGNSSTKVETLTVTRTGGTAAFDVNFATADGTATAADHDYAANSGTLHFDAGVNTQTISVTINGDTKFEPKETFFVNLSAATNGATISDSQGVGTIKNDDFNSAPGHFDSAGVWTPAGNGSDNTWHVGDFNGDGKADIFRYLGGEDVFLSTGTSFAHSGLWSPAGNGTDNQWQVGDFNGDGKDDIFRYLAGTAGADMFLSNGSSFVHNGNWTPAGSGSDGTWHVGDFNGDGKADIFRYVSGGEDVFLSNGTSFVHSGVWSPAGSGSDGQWYIGDFNGDGKSDIFRYLAGQSGADVFLSTGSGFVHDGSWTGAGVGSDGTWHLGDLNGDGKTDIFRYLAGQSGADVFLSNGSSFVHDASWTGAGIGTDNQWYVGDFNGDGTSDIFRQLGGADVLLSHFG